jgi:hypothetical protein
VFESIPVKLRIKPLLTQNPGKEGMNPGAWILIYFYFPRLDWAHAGGGGLAPRQACTRAAAAELDLRMLSASLASFCTGLTSTGNKKWSRPTGVGIDRNGVDWYCTKKMLHVATDVSGVSKIENCWRRAPPANPNADAIGEYLRGFLCSRRGMRKQKTTKTTGTCPSRRYADKRERSNGLSRSNSKHHAA